MKLTRSSLRRLIEQEVQKDIIVVNADDKEKVKALASDLANQNDETPEEIMNLKLGDLSENKKIPDISEKQIDKAIISCLKKEGGAAGLGMLIDAVMSLETKTKKLPTKLAAKAKVKKYILKHPALLVHKYKDIILIQGLPKSKLNENLEKINFYKKYSYGLDDIPNKTKAHDDIIGHT